MKKIINVELETTEVVEVEIDVDENGDFNREDVINQAYNEIRNEELSPIAINRDWRYVEMFDDDGNCLD